MVLHGIYDEVWKETVWLDMVGYGKDYEARFVGKW